MKVQILYTITQTKRKKNEERCKNCFYWFRTKFYKMLCLCTLLKIKLKKFNLQRVEQEIKLLLRRLSSNLVQAIENKAWRKYSLMFLIAESLYSEKLLFFFSASPLLYSPPRSAEFPFPHICVSSFFSYLALFFFGIWVYFSGYISLSSFFSYLA